MSSYTEFQNHAGRRHLSTPCISAQSVHKHTQEGFIHGRALPAALPCSGAVGVSLPSHSGQRQAQESTNNRLHMHSQELLRQEKGASTTAFS